MKVISASLFSAVVVDLLLVYPLFSCTFLFVLNSHSVFHTCPLPSDHCLHKCKNIHTSHCSAFSSNYYFMKLKEQKVNMHMSKLYNAVPIHPVTWCLAPKESENNKKVAYLHH